MLDRGDGTRGVRFRVWLPLSMGVRQAAVEPPAKTTATAGTAK